MAVSYQEGRTFMVPCKFFATTLAATVVAFSAGNASAEEFTARLSGLNEPLPVLSDATGTLKLDLDERAGTATWTLTYSNVGNTSPLTATVVRATMNFAKCLNLNRNGCILS
jgi:hypothetical protein